MRRSAVFGLCALLACAALAGGAWADQVRVGNLVLTADGGFDPRLLPKRAFAPISFHGRANIRTTDGSVPPALRRIRLSFDRDGKLTTAGLPSCSPVTIDAASPQRARQACAGALVGTGKAEAAVVLPGSARVDVTSPLSIFNGPRLAGNATVLVHAQNTYPTLETYVMVVPIERLSGGFAYRATLDLPEIAGGHGALTQIEARIGRRYRAGGRERSYISARCSDGILQTRGLASFADGTIVSGTIFKPCTAR